MKESKASEPAAPAAESRPSKQRRGFAAMDPAKAREISRRGGIAAHRAGTAHEFTRDEAREAGRKGGLAPRSGRQARAESGDRAAAGPGASEFEA